MTQFGKYVSHRECAINILYVFQDERNALMMFSKVEEDLEDDLQRGMDRLKAESKLGSSLRSVIGNISWIT
jgi:hypothetical protein